MTRSKRAAKPSAGKKAGSFWTVVLQGALGTFVGGIVLDCRPWFVRQATNLAVWFGVQSAYVFYGLSCTFEDLKKEADVVTFLFSNLTVVFWSVFGLLVSVMPFAVGFGNRCKAQEGCGKWWSREQVRRDELSRHLSPATENKPEDYVVRYLVTNTCKHGCGLWQREITVRERV